MIISKQKDFNYILERIANRSVFIVGCSECATLCHSGGEEEVLKMKQDLESNGIEVTGWVVLDPACHLQNDRRLFRKHEQPLSKAQSVLVLACGNGFQTVSEIVDRDKVVSGVDTLFLGEIKHVNEFEKNCLMCGDCIADSFDGFCPVARCPKHMMNGPCGGSVNGKCEVDPELDCVWEQIYRYAKQKNQDFNLKKYREPKDWSKSLSFRRKF